MSLRPLRLLVLLVASTAWAQEFEVASIRVSDGSRAAGTSGGPGSSDPTHHTWTGATVFSMLMRAYDVRSYQISAPEWTSFDEFDIAVGMPEETTKEQFAAMWRNLLAGRFGVKVRAEKKELPADELVVGPRGHGLKEVTGAEGAGLFTEYKGTGRAGIMLEVRGRAQSVGVVVDRLAVELGHPVVDKTGLVGQYDFTITYEFAPTRLLPVGAGAVEIDLPGALAEQLGLRLERGKKGMFDYVVVEKAERVPTDN